MGIHEVGLSCRMRSGIQWYALHGLRVEARNDNTGPNDESFLTSILFSF